MNYIILYN